MHSSASASHSVEPLHHVRRDVAGVGEHAEAAARSRERVLARLARVVGHRIRLNVDAADRERSMRAQVLHARDRRQRARRARRHPYRRVVTFRERRDALRVIGMLVRDRIAVTSRGLPIDGLQTLLDDLARQAAVDHQQRRAELDERSIAAAAAAERDEAQRHARCPGALQRDPRQRSVGPPLPCGVYTGIGNCATLPPSAAVILLTPCLSTSSMRST